MNLILTKHKMSTLKILIFNEQYQKLTLLFIGSLRRFKTAPQEAAA